MCLVSFAPAKPGHAPIATCAVALLCCSDENIIDGDVNQLDDIADSYEMR